jgi:hypothetical protein
MSEYSSEPVTSTPSQLMGASHPPIFKQLEQTNLGNLLDMPNDEPMQTGSGTCQLGACVALASMRGRPLLRINGMGVVMYGELPSTP